MVEEYRMIFDHDLYHCQAIIYIQNAHGFIIIEASVAVKKNLITAVLYSTI